MSGWLSTYAPTDGSRVNPWTPLPVLYTSMVEEPYRTYPGAPGALPGWSTQADTSCRPSAGRRSTEKVVPTLTFTSMLLDPSSGSNTTAYLAAGGPWWPAPGRSFSSDATNPTESRQLRAWRRASLAYTSSFCCSSP